MNVVPDVCLYLQIRGFDDLFDSFLDQTLLKGFCFYVIPIRYKCLLCISLKSTDLGSLIGNTQCGNIRILLPLNRFYVKTIMVISKPQKLPFWPFEQLWILNFWELLTYSHGQKLFTFTKQVLSKPVSRKIISAKIG